MIKVDYSDRSFKSMARTLYPADLGQHDSGWNVTGKVVEDWYEWVNDFEATHPTYGNIKGNFEVEVVAETQEAFDHFIAHHPPNEWDYYDI